MKSNETSDAWGWNPIINRMNADHCRLLLAMGRGTLARIGWTDADIRQIERKAA